VCGQENIIVKESFWGIISHFFKDITHYDGKFLSTLKYLLFRPGFLPAEYLRGRRVAYLNPIRLYVFTSAVFFLIFFTFYQKDQEVIIIKPKAYILIPKLEKRKKNLSESLKTATDKEDSLEMVEDINLIDRDIAILKLDTNNVDAVKSTNDDMSLLTFSSNENRKKYRTIAEYDSFQNKLSSKDQDNYFVRKIERQNLYLREKYSNNGMSISSAIKNDFMHRFPQMLFVGLPLFAFLLKFLYLRRKKYFYVSHLFFSIYLFCAYFIIILLSLWVSSIGKFFNTDVSKYINAVILIGSFVYLYKAIRYFYEQGRIKTLLKYFLLLFLSIFAISLIFILFFLVSSLMLK
jgi:hypothetical protein